MHHTPMPTAMSGTEPSRRVFLLLLGLILAVSLGLRLWDIGTPQLWEDDYLNLDRASLDPVRIVAIQQYQGPADTIFDFQPPLSYLLVHMALAVSKTALAARIPSLIAGLLSILGIGLLGATCAGRRAGLVAAALAGASLFHIEFSRAIKPYALFFCGCVFSQYLLVKATSRWRPIRLADFAAVTFVMLCAAYQGVPTLLAEGVYIVGLYVARKGIFTGPEQVGRLVWTILAVDAAVLLWLPLAPGLLFVREFLENPSINPSSGLNAVFFSDVLTGFLHLNQTVPLVFTFLAAALIGLGLATSRRAPAFLVFLTAAVPSAVVLSSQTDLRPLVSWRHLITVFPAVAIFCGAGISFLAEQVCRLLPRRRRRLATLVLAAVLVGVVMAPTLANMEEYYRRSLSQDRDLFRALGRLSVPAGTALLFTGYQRNTKAFAARWHLPGRFAGPGDFAAPGLGRTLVVDQFIEPSQRLRARPRGTLLDSWRVGAVSTRVALAGLPSRAPLLLAPDARGECRYVDDFRDWRYYNDAFASANFTVDTEVGLLRPTRYEMPAVATWRFDLPQGGSGARVTAAITAALYKRHPDVTADALLTVSASADGRAFTPLGRIGHADFLLPDGTPRTRPRRFFEEIGFYHECREATIGLDLSPYAAAGTVYLRVEYAPGVREGFINLAGVRVTADGLPQSQPPVDPLAFYAANLARNCASKPYRPGLVLLGSAAYVFAAPDHSELAGPVSGGASVNTPGELAAFTTDHPGLAPAFVLPDAEGKPAVVVYDPALGLTRGAVALSDAAPRAEIRLAGDEACRSVGTLWIKGSIKAPTLRLGDTVVPVPVAAPEGTLLRLTPGGQGLLTFSPDFDPPDFTDGPSAHFRNMAASSSYPDYAGGVTCQPNTYCSFEYVFVSAFPMTEVRLMAYPRLYGEPGGPGSARMSYSTDGRTFKPVMNFQKAETGHWTPMFLRRFVRLRLAKPATFLTVRYRLFANASAEFWSPTRPVDRMAVEAVLDTRTLRPFSLPTGDFPAELSGGEPGNDLRLWFGNAPAGLERAWPGE